MELHTRSLIANRSRLNMSNHIDCRTSYDLVADEYVKHIFDELRHKSLDRQLLDRFAGSVRAAGPACDMGCGPGHIAAYLQRRGVRMCGIDLSTVMVERARQLVPGVEFQQGDMLALDAPAAAWAGIVAFYSIIHIGRPDLPTALGEFFRVLRPGGLLLAAFHLGEQTLHLEEWWGRKVCVDFHLFRSDEVADYLCAAGFIVEEIIERDPYPNVEHPSRRSYIFAGRPETGE